MLEINEEEPTFKSECPEERAPTNDIPRLCTRCKAEMMVEEWDNFFFGMPKEVNRWFAFPNSVKDKVCHDLMLERHLAKGLMGQPSKKKDEKGEQDWAIQRVLGGLYGLRSPRPQTDSHGGLGAPLRQQGYHFGYPKGHSQEASRRAFNHRTEGERKYGLQAHPCHDQTRNRLSPVDDCPRVGLKPRVSYYGGNRLGATPSMPDFEFLWLTARKVRIHEKFGPVVGNLRMRMKLRVWLREDNRVGARTTLFTLDVEFP